MSHSSERYHEYGGNRPTAEQREAVREHLETQRERQRRINEVGIAAVREAGNHPTLTADIARQKAIQERKKRIS